MPKDKPTEQFRTNNNQECDNHMPDNLYANGSVFGFGNGVT
jgi:hypothetical protein